MEYQAGSAGIQIQKIVDVLETGGEEEWARRIDEAYYSHFGIDSVRAALGQLRLLLDDDDVCDRLELRDQVAGLVKVFSIAAGEGDSLVVASTERAGTARQLLESITKERDEEIKPLGSSAAAGARQLLETLREERR
jgi:hypothetical protein